MKYYVDTRISYANAPHLIGGTSRKYFKSRAAALIHLLLPADKPVDYCTASKSSHSISEAQREAMVSFLAASAWFSVAVAAGAMALSLVAAVRA